MFSLFPPSFWSNNFVGRPCFSLLIVVVDPSYFNKYHWAWLAAVFWCLRLYRIAGWLRRFLQTDWRRHTGGPLLSPTYPPSIYSLNGCRRKQFGSRRLLVSRVGFYAFAGRFEVLLGACAQSLPFELKRDFIALQLPPSPYM